MGTDIFSLGSTCYLMLYGTYPYQIDKRLSGDPGKAMRAAIATDYPRPTYIADVAQGLSAPSLIAKSFVQTLLERDHQKRPTATEGLQLSAMENTHKPAPGQGESLRPAVQLAKQCTFEKTQVDPTHSRSYRRDISLSKMTFIDNVSDCSTTASGECETVIGI